MSELGEYIKKKYNRTDYLTAGERHENKLEIQRKWREKNREKVRQYAREGMKRRRENSPQKVKEYKLLQYEKHRAYFIEKSRLWRIGNRERYNMKARELYEKRTEYRNRQRCLGCECILKEKDTLLCTWCLYTYPGKYDKLVSIMKALNDFVLLIPIESKKTKTVIILVEQKPKHITAQVVSVGKDCKELKKGDVVLISPYMDEIEYNDTKYLLCREKDLSVKI